MKLSPLKLIIFNSISNIIFINTICFPILINNYGNNATIVLTSLIILFTIISFLFCSLPQGTNILKRFKHNYLIRSLTIIYLVLTIIFATIISSIAIKQFFYINIGVVIIYSLIILTSLYVSTQGFPKIVNLSIIFFLFTVIFYLIPLSHLKERYFEQLLPLNYPIKDIYKCLVILLFPLDNIVICLNCDSIKGGFSRKILILSNIFSGLYLLIILIDAITLVSANFYINMIFGGIYRWRIYEGLKFLENFDIFILIIILVSTIFRLAMYLDLLRKTLYLKKNKITLTCILVSFIILGSTLYAFKNNLQIIQECALYFNLFLITIIFIYFVILSRSKTIKDLRLKNKEIN